jgi:hypothetical protein
MVAEANSMRNRTLSRPTMRVVGGDPSTVIARSDSDEAIQLSFSRQGWIASLRSQ